MNFQWTKDLPTQEQSDERLQRAVERIEAEDKRPLYEEGVLKLSRGYRALREEGAL